MKVVSLEELLQLHALIIRETGGADGLRDLSRLEAALAAQTQNVYGEELYKSLHEKAAAMCRGIIGDHPFVDGNKRTGMLLALTFLEVNGFKFVAEKGVLEDFAVVIAVERLNIAKISEWLKCHSISK